MPRLSDKLPINNKELDRRVKLTQADREQIVIDYATGLFSQRALATKYGVSRRTIQFTLNPHSLESAKKQFAERQKDGRYYDRERHTAYQRKHREYKKELYQNGLIKKENE